MCIGAFDGNHWLMSDISLGGHSKFHQNDYKTIKSAAVRAAIRRQRPVAIVPIRPSRAPFYVRIICLATDPTLGLMRAYSRNLPRALVMLRARRHFFERVGDIQ